MKKIKKLNIGGHVTKKELAEINHQYQDFYNQADETTKAKMNNMILSGQNYSSADSMNNKSKRDFELLSNLGGNLNRQAMNIFRKYKINNGAVEEHDSEEPFIMDIDGDGIYLLKRIDQNVLYDCKCLSVTSKRQS